MGQLCLATGQINCVFFKGEIAEAQELEVKYFVKK